MFENGMLEERELKEMFGDNVSIIKPYTCTKQEVVLPDGTRGFFIQESRIIWRSEEMNVTIYVNDQKVRREDLKNIEITNEAVKRMLAEKLSGKEEKKEST